MQVEDIITVDFWENLVKELNSSKVRFCSTENIKKLFEQLEREPCDPFVLVSGCCDFGLRLQAENHPNEDLYKYVPAAPWNQLASNRDDYTAVRIGPACDMDQCNVKDKYILKCDRFSISSFNEIPASIAHWFTTNLDVVHPRVSWIPFGLNYEAKGIDALSRVIEQRRLKDKLLYVNFQDNTLERMRLKQYFSSVSWVTFRPKANLAVEEYYREMSEHKFVLSSAGNGLDCYRTYEAMALGCVPLVPLNMMATHMLNAKLPVMAYDNLCDVEPSTITDVWEHGLQPCNLQRATKSFWREEIQKWLHN